MKKRNWSLHKVGSLGLRKTQTARIQHTRTRPQNKTYGAPRRCRLHLVLRLRDIDPVLKSRVKSQTFPTGQTPVDPQYQIAGPILQGTSTARSSTVNDIAEPQNANSKTNWSLPSFKPEAEPTPGKQKSPTTHPGELQFISVARLKDYGGSKKL